MPPDTQRIVRDADLLAGVSCYGVKDRTYGSLSTAVVLDAPVPTAPVVGPMVFPLFASLERPGGGFLVLAGMGLIGMLALVFPRKSPAQR